jgi:hypothetical protein
MWWKGDNELCPFPQKTRGLFLNILKKPIYSPG